MRAINQSVQRKIEEMVALPYEHRNGWRFEQNGIAAEILNSPARERVDCVFALTADLQANKEQHRDRSLKASLLGHLLKVALPFEPEELRELILSVPRLNMSGYGIALERLLFAQTEQFKLNAPLDAFWKNCISQLRESLSPTWCAGEDETYRYGSNSTMFQIRRLLDQTSDIGLERGDAWADAALADLEAMSEDERAKWLAAFEHAGTAKSGKPNEKWLQKADELLQSVGRESFASHLESWLSVFGKDDGWWFADREERNDASFKGLVWMASRVQNPEVVRALGAALRGSVKARGRAGVRSQKVCNAALWALGCSDEVEAVSAIAGVKRSVKHGAILKTIEKTLAEVAARFHVAPEDLEELATPDFGLQDGAWKRDFDGTSLEVAFGTGQAVWNWTSAQGKPLKSAPASVKSAFAGELKELKAQAGEVEKVLAALKERLDLGVRDEKIWPVEAWHERYLDHRLASLVANRVIWEWSGDNGANWSDFLPQLDAAPVPDGAQVRLWHPIFHPAEEVLRWRRRLEDEAVQQPWKQAHREVYRLTDAERATGTYSNRFAAHVLKQHQFNALCGARGWKNQLRLMVDADYPPAFKLWPRHDLRAEFWIEGIGENYGQDTNETGTYLRLATDQVRFYRTDAPENRAHAGGGGYAVNYRQAPAPALELEEIPPLVFSETMRDIDLFVGVSSIGNDPSWQDGGPQGRFRDYWQRFGFGELEESARSRADTLSRLLPRLAIRDRARVEGRFLRVEGRLRAYKIHLGSGNILMEPNDEYLCIVPKSSGNEVFLPFEGDRTLAVILSKALLLAQDDTIKDASIVSQIRRK